MALDRQAVARFDARDQRQRLRVQLAGVQRGDGDGQAVARDQVGEHHVLGAQAGGLHDGAGMFGRGRLQHGHGVRHALVEVRSGAGIQRDGAS